MAGNVSDEVIPRTWSWRLVVRVVLVLAAFPSAARAQMEEHGFVEPCTIANVEEGDLDCEVCASAFGSRVCDEKLKPKGYAKKCRTRGTHAGWDEIWCAPRKPPEPKTDGVAGLLIGVLGTLAAAVVVLRVISGKAKT